MAKTIITANDSIMDIFTKMDQGNIGARSVLREIFSRTEQIDPDNLLGGFGGILSLDTYNIYGEDIWIMFTDICDRNLTTFVGLGRAAQLGFMDIRELRKAISEAKISRKHSLDVENYMAQVRERLPNFSTN